MSELFCDWAEDHVCDEDACCECGGDHCCGSSRCPVSTDAPLECLDRSESCDGPVEYRMPLSGTGKSFPRCDHHWSERLDRQEEIDRRYPDSPFPPSDFDPTYAGERWDEDY